MWNHSYSDRYFISGKFKIKCVLIHYLVPLKTNKTKQESPTIKNFAGGHWAKSGKGCIRHHGMNIFFFCRFSKTGREGEMSICYYQSKNVFVQFFSIKLLYWGKMITEWDIRCEVHTICTIDGGHISSRLCASTEEVAHPISIIGKGISGGFWLSSYSCHPVGGWITHLKAEFGKRNSLCCFSLCRVILFFPK